MSPDLPSGNNIRTVVDHYFANIHPLRCFAFVHRPSFTRQLDKGLENDDEKALLYTICAQGAKYDLSHPVLGRITDKPRFYALSLEVEDQDAKANLIRAAGNRWAQKAELLVLTNFGKISIQRLMVRLAGTSLEGNKLIYTSSDMCSTLRLPFPLGRIHTSSHAEWSRRPDGPRLTTQR